jgi:cation:H+ antiporter
MEFLVAALGLGILLLAGDALVRGAVNLSLRLGVPALLVSLTIVAFGTSAPELLIAIQAVLEDAPGIALGNVVGSNTANVLLVLGVPAVIAGIDTHKTDVRRSYWMMLAGSALFILLAFLGPFHIWHALVLLAALAGVLGWQARSAIAHHRAGEEDELDEIEGVDPKMRGWKIALYLVVGLVGLPLGADLLVGSSTEIARMFGISETVIGLTLVAIGTSLPELATSVAAAFRKQADVALGNVVGSNMFNLLAIIGIASFFGEIPVAREFLVFDLWVMLAASVVLAPFVLRGRRMSKRWGAAFLALYAAYLVAVVTELGAMA